jgi:catechol 2,3-dioxygenase-like lactoylglutathione lyase family enzyme
MSNTFFGVAIDCSDAAAVANFWAEVLGRQIADHPTREHAVVLVDDAGAHGPRLAFHQVPEPKTVKNRLHLDLITTEFEAETDRLVALGAHRVRDLEQGGGRWTTFREIEGNEFDLIAG